MPRDEEILTKITKRRVKVQKGLCPVEAPVVSEPKDSKSKESEEEEKEPARPAPPPPQPTLRVGSMDIPKGAAKGLPHKGKQRVKETTKRSREEGIELIKEVIKGKKPKQRMVLEVEQIADAYQKLNKLHQLGWQVAKEQVQ